jgi:PhnB protein
MAGKPRPDDYHSVTPYLVVDGAARVIDFLKQVFNAEEMMRLAAPGGRIGHATCVSAIRWRCASKT